ncbi:MAG TPA: T9SS type A sorting domain-containing protein [Puia sp.]
MKSNWKAASMLMLAAISYFCPMASAQDCNSTTGATNAGTFTTASYSGSSASWSDMAYAQSSDANYAMTSIPIGFFSSAYSNYLVVKSFGFSIPSTGHVCKIIVNITRKAGGSNLGGYVADKSVRLTLNGALSNDLAVTSTHWSKTESTVTYGDDDISNTWGGTWGPSDVNSGTFGVAIATDLNSGIGSIQALINQVTVTIVYDANTLLAITLGKFTASPESNGDGALLNWTANAAMGDKFIVQRSGNSRDWKDIATVPAAQYSESGAYSYTDNNPLEGPNFYRLRMVDLNGRSIWSNISEVTQEKISTIRCWPNPCTNTIFISSPNAVSRIILMDIQGRVRKIQQALAPVKDWEIPAEGLPPGLYFIQVGSRVLHVLKE